MLEAERVGYGASGRSGGQLIPGWACGMAKLAAQLGPGDAKRLWDFSVEGVELTRELIQRNRIDCDLAWGHMHVGIKPRQRQELLEWQREQEDDFGYDKLRFMEREEVGPWIASERYVAGLLDSGAGHLHPLRYTIGVGQVAIAAGARIYENSRVTKIEHGPTVTLQTAKGSVRAKFVALCANVGHVDLSARLASKLIGVASYIVATKPLGAARANALLKDNVAVADLNWIIDYFRLSSDHRLLFGGRVSYSGLDPLGTARATRKRMLNVFPQLADAEIDYAWGGLIDISMSRAAEFRPARAERVLPARLFRPRHGRARSRARSSPRRSPARRSASTSSSASSTRISRAAGSSTPDAGDGDDLVPAAGPDALTSARWTGPAHVRGACDR